MSPENIAIRVENLAKCYQIYDRPQDRLKQSIVPRIRRLVGKAAPNYYREFWALRDISFEIRKGETVGIIGRNGSGKSTLLQVICGTSTPTSGTVQTTGRVAALLELGAGFNPEFTGRENVYLNGGILGLTRQAIDDRFDAIAAFADIGDFIDQPIKTYSSGMYVRLAFAVIAHVDADILVIDEALAVGDVFFTQKCMRFLRRFMQQGTVLFVSHDTAAVQNLCERALWLDQGKLRFAGSAKEASNRYLEAWYQAMGAAEAVDAATSTSTQIGDENVDFRDARLDYVNASPLRNDLEVFRFDPDSPSFGNGGARIELVRLVDSLEHPLSWVVGGEQVKLKITATTLKDVRFPIVGFTVKDRLGQALFGDNTYLTYHSQPLIVPAKTSLVAEFAFRMPILPAGDYTIAVAIAEGTQVEHVQHHWVHEALVLKSHASSVSHGLVGVPMRSVSLRVAS